MALLQDLIQQIDDPALKERILQGTNKLLKQLEDAIEGLIKAVNESNFCSTCSEEFGNLACSECPWHQAKIKAIRLLAKEGE